MDKKLYNFAEAVEIAKKTGRGFRVQGSRGRFFLIKNGWLVLDDNDAPVKFHVSLLSHSYELEEGKVEITSSQFDKIIQELYKEGKTLNGKTVDIDALRTKINL